MPRKKKEVKLKIEDIKRNPDIEKKHFIHKFIEHEHEIMLVTTALFMVLICAVIYIGAITIENKDKVEIYYDGSLKIKYNVDLTGVADIITLREENIVSEDNGQKAEYEFSVTNDSLTSVRYKVFIVEDEGMIDLDKCKDKIVNKEAIRYTINDKEEEGVLEEENDGFIINSGIIKSTKTKKYSLKIWIDKDSMEDVSKNHFHGRIIVVNAEE